MNTLISAGWIEQDGKWRNTETGTLLHLDEAMLVLRFTQKANDRADELMAMHDQGFKEVMEFHETHR